jgi:hypothetical protein
MRKKTSELAETARNARFWALYRQLPDSSRAGFFALAQGLARELEEQNHRGEDRDRLLPADIDRE